MDLNNKSILITGAGKGIGYSIALTAQKLGANVYAITISKKDVSKLKRENIIAFYGNASNKKLISKIIKLSKKNNQIITGLVNNAGERQRLDFLKINDKKIKHIFNVNFFTCFTNMQIFSEHLIKNKSPGSIVNIGSIVGQTGFNQLAGYASTKAALLGLTKSFAVEMAKNKIRANIVSPGFTKTSFFKKFKKKKKLYNWTLSRIPMKKWGNPEDVANLVCFLLSEESGYINGENINIDGGWISS